MGSLVEVRLVALGMSMRSIEAVVAAAKRVRWLRADLFDGREHASWTEVRA
ncbi:hypothetical protein AKJ09_08061 [Labilithrix luteola]|uniref:Uncharacterized protein n=1 Tax=Labilithrix luteola TaxID=1391654 RepID=A0A0K1Q6N5_9BACT|nr:hypothetical protein AKJ09_08061 [Labilithrix luteola]